MLKRGLEPPSLATADSKSAAYTIPPLEQVEAGSLGYTAVLTSKFERPEHFQTFQLPHLDSNEEP